MYTYKLNQIIFNNNERLQLENLTVIIGPNNVGKSRILKDIVQKTTKDQALPSVVVRDVEWTTPQNLQELREAYSLEPYQDENNHWVFSALAPELFQECKNDARLWTDDQLISRYIPDKSFFAQHFGFAMIAFLTTEYRLQLVKEAPSAAHVNQEINLLQTVYNAGSIVERDINNLVKCAFDKEIKFDFTVPQRLLFRVGDDFSSIPVDPRDARLPMEQYDKLDNQGDGIRSFVGITAALLAIKRNVILIDEPEAFLHPPQAVRIGKFIAEQANRNSNRQIILATHSTDLLHGILSETKDVTIIRIDRKDRTNYFNILDLNHLDKLVNDPLLSSSRVFDGLFYSGVTVVEADSDRRFYQTACRMRRNNLDLHFVNADNKQTVPTISMLYREMGVRCVGIVDFDVLNNMSEFKKQLDALDLSETVISEMLTIRKEIAEVAKELPPDDRLRDVERQIRNLFLSVTKIQERNFACQDEAKREKERLLDQIDSTLRRISDSTKNWKEFKEKGREALPTEIQLRFDKLWVTCSQKGLFINPCGELESMMTSMMIPYTTDKRGWIKQALPLLAKLNVNDDEHPWKFIKAIEEYFRAC